MAIADDQPRPDLDAAVDAVLSSLTAVGDDAVAASLRRSRIALADAASRRAGAGVGAWRWAVPAVLFIVALMAVAWWRPRPSVDAPRRVIADAGRPAPVTRVPPASRPGARAVPDAPPRAAATPSPRKRLARATSPAPPAPDPLIALTRAVQAIPDDAWSAMARARDPLTTPGFAIEPIVVPPLVTPPIADAPAAPLAEGDR